MRFRQFILEGSDLNHLRTVHLQKAHFFNDLDDLGQLDWPRLQACNFKRDPEDPERLERYEAEALIRHHLPVAGLLGIICYSDPVGATIASEIAHRGLALKAVVKPDWHF